VEIASDLLDRKRTGENKRRCANIFVRNKKKSTCVLFSGGSQWNLWEIILGSGKQPDLAASVSRFSRHLFLREGSL